MAGKGRTMEAFEYYNPVKVVFGEGTLKQIGVQAKEYGKRAMILTYEDCSFFADVLHTIHASLEESGVEWVDFAGVTANPLLCQARKGVEICREKKVDLVIGLGGGSVMDCAKVVAAGVVYPYDVKKMVMFSHSDVQSIAPTETLPTIMAMLANWGAPSLRTKHKKTSLSMKAGENSSSHQR